jgi:hypothetical protein
MTPLATAKFSVDRAADMLLPADRRGRNTLRAAMFYTDVVHDRDPAAMFEKLAKTAANDPERLAEIVVVLAGLVDVDKTPSQLLAWMCPPNQQPRPRVGAELCGTIDGHIRHVEADEDPCRPCQAAYDRQTAPLRVRDAEAKCPSPGGYQRHKRQGEQICDGCRDAMRAYWKQEYDTKKRRPEAPTREKPKCPSRQGYNEHKRLEGTVTCPGCIAENRRYYREWARKSRGSQTQAAAAERRCAPCGQLGARRRHQRKRERCDLCWPPGTVKLPAWYQLAVRTAATNHGGNQS